ncbi:MAG: cell division protein FtsB [Gammaproteobacteria bacterium]|nr:MAG: cell division protein FtsB [Gammaproteobacteria bacterium]
MKTLTVILITVLLLLQYKLWFGDDSVVDVWRLEKQVKEFRASNAELKERNRALEAEVKDLKQGLEAIEERSRSELGMVQKGETFYQIIEDDSGPMK